MIPESILYHNDHIQFVSLKSLHFICLGNSPSKQSLLHLPIWLPSAAQFHVGSYLSQLNDFIQSKNKTN